MIAPAAACGSRPSLAQVPEGQARSSTARSARKTSSCGYRPFITYWRRVLDVRVRGMVAQLVAHPVHDAGGRPGQPGAWAAGGADGLGVDGRPCPCPRRAVRRCARCAA
jgi:hypothetical protein